MYAHEDKRAALALSALLKDFPRVAGATYQVQKHRHIEAFGHSSETWGVVEYIPYCEAMPIRCNGFVWAPKHYRDWCA